MSDKTIRRLPVDQRVARIWTPMEAKLRSLGSNDDAVAAAYSVFLAGLATGVDIVGDHPVALGSPSVGRLVIECAAFVLAETKRIEHALPAAAH